ncbi:phosphodiesterase [Pseudaeromonas sp. ZJS20]|uniref:phosphodiesterase n=1 Tax=Pseudaeromonas aegiceratis TaxID=3153928 RepID=UPI00390CA929
MRLALLSDIHGDLAALEQALLQLAAWQPHYYLLLGDLLNHGPRNPVPAGYDPMGVAARLNGLRQQIIAVRGNCDSEVDQMLLQFPVLASHNQLLVDGHRFFMTHGHCLAEEGLPLTSADLLLTGHTHRVHWQKDGQGPMRFNPGSLAMPRDGQPASYGRYEADCLTLVERDSGAVLAQYSLTD